LHWLLHALQPSGLSTWEFWCAGLNIELFFLLLQCRNKGQIVTSERLYACIQSVTGRPCNNKLAKTSPLMPWHTVKSITPFVD
jgi:hypothetical protein